MFLVISQVIVLLASSGSVNQLPEPVSVNEQAITLDDLKAVYDDLNEVRKSLDGIKLYFDLRDGHIAVEKVVSKPVIVPPAPAVLKKDKKNIKSKHKMTENKKVVPIENSPVVKLFSVSRDDAKQLIEKSTDEIISAVEIKPVYIKHDINGQSLEENNKQWTCVFDTNTGLMWEVKSKEDAMRDSGNLYTWYNPNNKSLSNKTLKGVTDGGHCKGGTDCDTNAYVQAMNQRNFCGHNDWKLPTREQMQTLVDLKNGKDKVKINQQYFPQTVPSWYWTSSDDDKEEFAWYVLFRNGFVMSDLKERAKHIRLVRNNI